MIPSPRSNARMPAIQPRHDRCAMNTVISETSTPSRMKKPMRYLRVSALRRSTKLMSCTSTSVPSARPGDGIGNHVTWIGAGGNCRSTCASGPRALDFLATEFERVRRASCRRSARRCCSTRPRTGARPRRRAGTAGARARRCLRGRDRRVAPASCWQRGASASRGRSPTSAASARRRAAPARARAAPAPP